jgi:CHASE3 domain sensor protein
VTGGRPPRPARLTLRARLTLLLGISAVVLGVAAVILFSSLAALTTDRTLVVLELDPAVIAVRDLRAAMLDQETAVRGYVLTRETDFLDPYDEGQTAALVAAAELEPVVSRDPRTAADFEAFQRSVDRWRSEFAEPSNELTNDGDQQAARDEEFQAEGQALFDDVRATVDQLEDDLVLQRDAAVESLDRAAQRVWTVAVCVLLGLVTLGIVIIVALKRSVTDPIIELAEDVRRIADGDLDQTVSVVGTAELEALASDIDGMRLQILG